MNGSNTVRGRVLCFPVVTLGCTSFLLLTDQGICRVLRQEINWQRRDVVFLRPGQRVAVTGIRSSPGTLLAYQIRITDTGRQPENEER